MAFPTTSVLDNFTGTNGTDLPVYSANWQATPTGGSALEIQDNAATGTSAGGNNSNSWATDYGPDCEVYLTINTKPADGNVILLFARGLQTTSLLTVDGYVLRYVQNAGTDTFVIQRITNGAATSLSSTFNQEVTNGDSIGLEIVGNTLTAYYKAGGGAWTSLGSTTDSTYTAAGKLGILTSSTGVRLDDFGGGTYVAGDVTKALTGQAVTSGQGSVADAVSYALTGQSVTSNQGTVTVDNSVTLALSGQSITAQQGNVADSVTYALTGQSTTASQGNVNDVVSYSISGQSVTSTQGSVADSVSIGLTTQAITTAQGNISANGDVTKSLSGQSITVSLGNISAPSFVVTVETGAGAPPQRQKQRPVVVIRDDEEQAQVTIKQIKRLVARRIGKAPIKQEVERQAVELAQIFPIDLTEATELIDNITQQEIIANMRRRQNQDDEQAIKLLLGLE